MLRTRVYFSFYSFHTLYGRRLHLDAVFFVSFYCVLNCFPSLLDVTGIWGLPHNFRNSSLITATSSLITANCNNSSSAGCVSAAKLVCKDVYSFRKHITSLKQILCWCDILKSNFQSFFRVKGFSLVLLLYCFVPVIMFTFCVYWFCFCMCVIFFCCICAFVLALL